jgi:tellurite resistance protein TehA-like permease
MPSPGVPLTGSSSPDLRARVAVAVEGLTPGYFALVMGTGIVSVGLQLEGHRALSVALMVIAVVAYAVLVVLTLARMVLFPRAIRDDFTEPRRAFGFFTFVAGTNVVGARLVMEGQYHTTAGLLVVSGIFWLVLGYVVPWTAVLGRSSRPVVAAANGTWFIWVVSSQSVAVAAASIEPFVEVGRRPLAMLAVVAWSVGIFLYASAGIIVALRMMLYELKPEDLTPPYWVSMGACAITVLAGARIVEMAEAPMVEATRGLIAGTSVVFWAFATWLIPVLLAAGWWRHGYHRIPLTYEATLWSIVFPLGMYAVAGIYLGRADHLPVVEAIGSVELWFAFAAWALSLTSMLQHIGRTVLLRSRSAPPTSAATR